MAMEEIKQKFSGKWKIDRSENLEEFLKAYGANFVLRKAALNVNPEMTISVEGNALKILSKMAFVSREEVLKFNEEFNEEHNGVNFKAHCKYEDGKIIVDSEPIGSTNMKPQHSEREIVGDEMVVTLKVGDVVAKRYCKRVPE